MKAEYKQALVSVILLGSGIYLATLTFAMFNVVQHGYALWVADYLLTHGEPFLVAFLSAGCFALGIRALSGLRAQTQTSSFDILSVRPSVGAHRPQADNPPIRTLDSSYASLPVGQDNP